MKQKYIKNYTLIQSGYQLKFPLNHETVIASDDPVNRLYSSHDIETACKGAVSVGKAAV